MSDQSESKGSSSYLSSSYNSQVSKEKKEAEDCSSDASSSVNEDKQQYIQQLELMMNADKKKKKPDVAIRNVRSDDSMQVDKLSKEYHID